MSWPFSNNLINRCKSALIDVYRLCRWNSQYEENSFQLTSFPKQSANTLWNLYLEPQHLPCCPLCAGHYWAYWSPKFRRLFCQQPTLNYDCIILQRPVQKINCIPAPFLCRNEQLSLLFLSSSILWLVLRPENYQLWQVWPHLHTYHSGREKRYFLEKKTICGNLKSKRQAAICSYWRLLGSLHELHQ